ncbi:MAG: FecR family protein [Treponema sp.]|jgi:hypothetical protein|nr:FecR family protein [Treponema sp.]
MRKILFAVLLFTVAVCVIFAQNSSAETGVIRELSGEVELKVSGSDTFVVAKAGDVVALNTIVSTGFRSTAVIAVGSSVITVRPLTRLSLAEIQSSSGTENTNVALQTGRVRVEVTPPAGTRANFSVQSPSATASVRGTSFDFDTVNLTVNEGTVSFSGISGGPAAMVSIGSASFVGIDGEPANPVVVMDEALLPSTPVGTPAAETVTQPAPSVVDLSITIGY